VKNAVGVAVHVPYIHHHVPYIDTGEGWLVWGRLLDAVSAAQQYAMLLRGVQHLID
jgi:hypothetical protein